MESFDPIKLLAKKELAGCCKTLADRVKTHQTVVLAGSTAKIGRRGALIAFRDFCGKYRSTTASFSRRETVRNFPPVQRERIAQSSYANLLT
jgi:hypothetical protein